MSVSEDLRQKANRITVLVLLMVTTALFWGAVMAVLAVLPGIGTALVWVPAVAFLFAGGHTASAVGLALWCAIVVGSADNVLRPMLVGKETEMPGLLVMVLTTRRSPRSGVTADWDERGDAVS